MITIRMMKKIMVTSKTITAAAITITAAAQ
jgi:hypothetical protein